MEHKVSDRVELREVDQTNFYDCLDLNRKSSLYVGDAVYVLAEAYLYRHNSTAYLIYDGETAVGMVILLDKPEEKNLCYSFTDLFIADDFLGRGYGHKAAAAIIGKFRAENLRKKVEIQVHNSNKPAKKVYENIGFVKTGAAEWDEGFDVMELYI